MHILLLFCVLFIVACGDVPMEIEGDEQELYHNHRLLKAYFYHPERIKPFSEYQGMPIDSMYRSLNDYLKCPDDWCRYTRYYEPAKKDDKIDEIVNSDRYYSFGFERYLKEDTLIVLAVYPKSPANSGGLRKHDKLLFANDIPLTGEDAKLYLKSDSLFDNNTVFKVLRGEEIITLRYMQKEEVLSSTVFLDSLKGIPFITVTEFTTNTNNPNGTYQEFKDILKEIAGVKSAIIDLRGNPGGSILHCSKMAAELSPPNRQMIYDVSHYPVKNKNIIDTTYHYAQDYLSKIGDGVDIKWVILINSRSASCSERFTAALKSTRPDIVFIGQTTYGKGIGQTYVPTYAGGLAQITFLQTYYPNGKTFHEVGIEPNIVTDPKTDEIYEKALQAVQNFGTALAKRSASLDTFSLPPRHSTREIDLGAYLFHQGE